MGLLSFGATQYLSIEQRLRRSAYKPFTLHIHTHAAHAHTAHARHAAHTTHAAG